MQPARGLSFNEFAGVSGPRVTNFTDSISVFYLAFVNSVSFIRRLDLGACVTAFYSSRSDFVGERRAVIKIYTRGDYVPPRWQQCRQAIKFPPTSLWLVHFVFRPLPPALRHCRAERHFNFASEWSASKVRIAFHSLFMPRHAKVR